MPDTEITQDVIDAFVRLSHGDLPRVMDLLGRHPALLQARARWDESPLGAAAHAGSVAVAEFLLSAGAPLDICAAAMLGRAETVAAILRDDPRQVHARGAHGITVLFHAAIRGRVDVAELLVAGGAEVNAGADGNTALHGAAAFGQREMVAWLLARGADVNARDANRKTPLRLALDAGYPEVADLLQRHGGAA